MELLLIFGIFLIISGFIGFTMVLYDELTEQEYEGFDGWFWLEFKWWILGMLFGGMIMIWLFNKFYFEYR